jgi:hypothetical protein
LNLPIYPPPLFLQFLSIVDEATMTNRIGKAFIFVSYEGRLYITLQFMCSYMFNTELSFGPHLIYASIWNSARVVEPQYVDVIYERGFYQCYTLSIDLDNVCDADKNAT